jgi:hypothetical protein
MLTVSIGLACTLRVANAQIVVTADVSAAAAVAYEPGSAIITIPLSITGDRAGIAAVDLELACEGAAVRIKAVTFAPAFALVLKDSPEPLPGAAYRCSRGQSLSALEEDLGVEVGPVPLATVDVEVLSGAKTGTQRVLDAMDRLDWTGLQPCLEEQKLFQARLVYRVLNCAEARLPLFREGLATGTG